MTYPDGRVALKGISLAFNKGEQAAIIGPSGAGKTTLLSVIACGLKSTAGHLHIHGEDPWNLPKSALHRLRGRSFLAPQSPPLPPRQRVVHAVLAGALPRWNLLHALKSLVKPADAATAFAALERFKLGDKLWLRCDRLSGGERQRVALARLLVSNAPLLLLDEPVSALDPALGLTALATLQEEATARNATLIASLHDINLARSRFERLIGVKNGAIEFDLPAHEVTESRLQDLYGKEYKLAKAEAVVIEEFDDAGIKISRCF